MSLAEKVIKHFEKHKFIGDKNLSALLVLLPEIATVLEYYSEQKDKSLEIYDINLAKRLVLKIENAMETQNGKD